MLFDIFKRLTLLVIAVATVLSIFKLLSPPNSFTDLFKRRGQGSISAPACFIQTDDVCLLGAATKNKNEQVYCAGPLHNMACNNSVRSIVKTGCNGRLGNAMMAYATLYYFTRLGFSAMLTELQSSLLTAVFNPDSLAIKKGHQNYPNLPIDSEFIGETDDVGDISYVHFLANPDKKSHNHILDIGMYPEPFYLFMEIWPLLMDQFQFKPEILESARRVISKSTLNIRKKYPDQTLVYVAVHHRRGDFLDLPYFQDIYTGDVMLKYFLFCMDIFRLKYNSESSRVVFLMLSDDVGWMRDQLGGHSDAVFPQDERDPLSAKLCPGRDLAIFSLCNHTIRGWGTFSLWGSLLSGGEATYPSAGRANRDERHIEKLRHPHHHKIDIYQFF